MALRDDFARANRAFDLFTLPERERALEKFSRLRYPVLIDRFFQAVYEVIRENDQAAASSSPGKPSVEPQEPTA